MNVKPAETVEFLDKIEGEFGLVFDDGRKEQVEEALLTRRSELQLSHSAYLRRLDEDKAEWERLAELLTVPESYFFRHADQLRALLEVAVPASMAAHRHDPVLRILSIGCAAGEEPYSIAMALLEHPELTHGWKISIRACDVNPEAVRRAHRGIYTGWALRATPPASKARWFMQTGNRYRLADEVRHCVKFDVCNAMQLYPREAAESVDIVFFRNVLIYFSPEAIRASIDAVAHLLAPGGYLFLGPAETLRGVSTAFNLCHTHETFYYQRRNRIGRFAPFSPFHREPAPPEEAPAKIAPAADGSFAADEVSWPRGATDTTWMEEIQRSAERIRGLHRGRPSGSAATPNSTLRQNPPARVSPAEQLQRLLALLSGERYEQALTEVAHLPAELAHDADIQLLRAIAHVNRRELAEGEAACRAVLARDSMNASGHYILALCREQAGDLNAAADHDRVAIYLDGGFAMPHMHLALIARRRGDHHTARHEFEKAHLLLAREDSIRLTMFGGGFSREALRDLCRRELRGLGTA